MDIKLRQIEDNVFKPIEVIMVLNTEDDAKRLSTVLNHPSIINFLGINESTNNTLDNMIHFKEDIPRFNSILEDLMEQDIC